MKGKNKPKGLEILSLMEVIESRCGELLELLDNCNKKNNELQKLVIEASKALRVAKEADKTHQLIKAFDGKEADITGTGGVLLIENTKNAISTAVSNVSGVGSNIQQVKKRVQSRLLD